MNIPPKLIVVTVLIGWLVKPCYPDERIPLGVSFVSPNGRYSLHLEELNGSTYFVIKDMMTEQSDRSIMMPTALLYLHWAANSRSFVTVEHIAKGSRGRVVYLDGDKWKDVELDPPFKGIMDHTAIRLELASESVHYKFAVTNLTRDWKPIDYWFCDLDVRLKTGTVFNVKWTPVSQQQWAASLWPRKRIYLPPMTDQVTHVD